MNNRLWLLIAAIASVGVLLMGWFLGVSPKLDEMNTAQAQHAEVDTQNAAIQQNIDLLRKDSKKLEEFKKELAEAQIALPSGDGLSTFLGQLHELEGASGVKLESFSSSSGLPFTPVANGTGTTTSTLVTPSNFIVIPIDLKVGGTRAQVLDFVHALQFGKRLFLVNSLTVQSGGDTEEGFKGNISGFVYVLVDPSAPPPTVTPIAPVDPSPSPSATPAK